MTKQVYRLFLLGFISIVLAACQGQTADTPEEEVGDNSPVPSPLPDSELIAIDQSFLSSGEGEQSDSLNLYTFSVPETNSGSIEVAEVYSAKSGIALELNTSSENGAKPDVTILVSNDSVYKVDHETNELTLLKHFTSEVCEVIAKEAVISSVTGEGESAIETFSVLHDESVYVSTAINSSDSIACSDQQASRYYYNLPFDNQFDLSNSNASTSNESVIVDESEAKAKLVFGWVRSSDESDTYQLSYGYLGYSHALRKLEFFDHERNSVWIQSRELATYNVDSRTDDLQFYLFDVRPLDGFQYLVQLNQDVFVIDASTEFFAKSQADVDTILTDRIFKQAGRTDGIVSQVETYHDNDDLIIIDQGKIFSYAYLQNALSPSDTIHNYQVPVNYNLAYQEKALQANKTFSQFDYHQCAESDQECLAYHNVEAPSWQFITDCETELGCEVESIEVDVCETVAEANVSQSGRDICSPEFYMHLDELNEPSNDAEFLGYMQYFDKAINHYHANVLSDTLLISTSMREKDVLVQYDYKQTLSSPKSVRERVLLGAESDLYGVRQYVENDNLFINALLPADVRSNECYKNHVRVSCDLASQEEGGAELCTGKDLSDGKCHSSFMEFESVALFCSQQQIEDRECIDSSLNAGGLRMDTDQEDSRWVRMLDLSGEETDKYSMFLLRSERAVAENAQVFGEGLMLSPTMFEFDDSDGVLGSAFAMLNDKVETVLGGVLYQKADESAPSFEGILDILTEDASILSSSGSVSSFHSKYAILNTLDEENNAVSVRQMSKLAELVYSRVDTTPKFSVVSE